MTIDELLRVLLRRWWLLLLLGIIGGAAGYAIEDARANVYEATGRVVIGPDLEDRSQIIESTGSLDRSTLPQTLAEVATGSEVRRAAGEQLTGPIGDAYDVDSVVIPGTSVVEVAVTGPSERSAIDVASAVLAESESLFEGLFPVYDVALLDEPSGSDGPVSPNPELGAVIGAIVGVLLGSIIAVAADRRHHARGAVEPAHGARAGAERPAAVADTDRSSVATDESEVPHGEPVRVGGGDDPDPRRP